MIDSKILREAPEKIQENLEKRNITNFPLVELLDLDKKRRELISKNQKLKEERNRISLQVSKEKSAGRDVQELIAQMRVTSDQISENDRDTQIVISRVN